MLPKFCYEKAFWIVISIFSTVLMSVTGVVWGMLMDNNDEIKAIELQIREDNVPDLKITVKSIDEKVDQLLITQARIETKLNTLAP